MMSKTQRNLMIVPTVIQLETLNGTRSARCPMCTIDKWTRPFNRMEEDAFARIPSRFEGTPDKVRMARDFGIPEVGFPSNRTNLSEDMGRGEIANLKHCGSYNVPDQRDHRELESVALPADEM